MADDTDLVHLVASLEMRTDQLDKAISQSQALFDKQLSAIEARSRQFEQTLPASFARAGQGAVRGLMGALGGAVSINTLKNIVESIGDQVENIEKQSKALGVSTDAFQVWSLAAARAGVDQDTLNAGLDIFSKNLGDAQLHQTAFGKDAQALGVNLKGTVEQAFYQYIDGLSHVGNESQRAALMQMAFGRGAVQMLPMIQEGSAALKAQGDQFRANGEIIDHDAIEKISQMKSAWGDMKAELTAQVGATVISGMTGEFKNLTDYIKDPQFQAAMRSFGNILAQAAIDVAKMSGGFGGEVGRILEAGAGGGVSGAWDQAGIELQHDQNPAVPTDRAGYRSYSAGAKLANDQYSARHVTSNAGTILDALGFSDADQQRGELQQKIAQDRAAQNAAFGAQLDAKVRKSFINPGAQPDIQIAGRPGNIDLSNSLQDQSAFAKAVQGVKDRIAAMQQMSGVASDSTEETEKERTATELLTAAQEDAAKTGAKVTDAQKTQIDQLATAYGKLAGSRAFEGDLATEDKRIAKLAAEGDRARLTATALGALEEKEQLIADWHSKNGDGAIPASDMTQIDARAKAFGTATGGDAMGKSLQGAQDQARALQDQIAVLGLFGGAAAEAQMRLQLLNDAQKAGVPLTAALSQQIDGLAKTYGQLTQASQSERLAVEQGVQLNDQFREGLANLTATGVVNFKSLQSAARDFVDQLLEMIVRMQMMQALTSVLGPQGSVGQGSLGSYTSGLTALLLGGGAGGAKAGAPGLTFNPDGSIATISGAASTAASSASTGGWAGDVANWIGSFFAGGGVMTPRGPMALRRYAAGGIASSPQVAMFGEGDDNEAFVPLPDGRRIPVKLNMPKLMDLGQLQRAAAAVRAQQTTIHYNAPAISIAGGNSDDQMAQVKAMLDLHERNVKNLIHSTVTDMSDRRQGPWND